MYVNVTIKARVPIPAPIPVLNAYDDFMSRVIKEDIGITVIWDREDDV